MKKTYIILLGVIVGIGIAFSISVFGLSIPKLPIFYIDGTTAKPRGAWDFDFLAGDITTTGDLTAASSTLSGNLTTTGRLSVGTGTAAAPSIYFGTDVDTGFYHSAVNILGFAVSGGKIFEVDSYGILMVDGVVGAPSYTFANDDNTGFYRIGPDNIGMTLNGLEYDFSTTTFDAKSNNITTTGEGTFNNLNIEGAIPILVFKDNNSVGDASGGYIEWRDSNNTRLGYFGNASSFNDDLFWKNESNGGHLLLGTTGGGNVGIGTASPGAKLEVGDGDIWIFDSGSNPRVVIGDSSAAGSYSVIGWNSASDFMHLGTQTGGVNTLVLTEGGNVGIGTTSPSSTLHVIGNITAASSTLSGNLDVKGNVVVDSNTVNLSDTTDEYVLAFDTTTQTWRGIAAGAGTVTSVAMSVPTGLSMSGSPITTSGTLALALSAGYVIPLTASTTEWATAYDWGDWNTNIDISTDTNLVGGTGITLTDDTLSVDLGTSIDISDETNMATSTGVSLIDDTIGLILGEIDHDSLLNFVGDEHIDWTASSTLWDTAYGWGDHSGEGYLTTVAYGDLTGYPADVITAGDNISWSASTTLNVADAWWDNLTDMTLTDNYIYVGDASNDPVGVAMSNDCTIASDGVITCDHDALDNYLSAEHVDWAGASAGTIHTDNYIENATHTGDVTGATALTIGNDKVLEAHLKAVDAAGDEECLTFESTTGDFEWQACGSVAALNDIGDVTITSVADGELIRWNGSAWINNTLAEAGIQAQGAVLDDLNTLGANTGLSQFLVGALPGALAWQSGATARGSLGLGSSATVNFGSLVLSGGFSMSVLTVGSIPFITTNGAFIEDNSNLFWDDDNNRLGLGTTSPSSTLHVIGNITAASSQPDIIANWTNTGQYGRVLFQENGTDIGVFQAIGSTFATASRRGDLEFFATAAGNDISFWTGNAQRFVVKDTGIIGIGTDSPTAGYKLHVHNSTGLNIAKFTGTGSWPKVNLFAGTTGGAFNILTAAGGNGLEFAFNDSTNDGYLQIFGNNEFYIYTNSQKRLVILGDGKIGMGDDSPGSTLEVNGGITPDKVASDPCAGAGFQEGSMFYNDTSNYYCYCDGTNDVQMHDPSTACF